MSCNVQEIQAQNSVLKETEEELTRKRQAVLDNPSYAKMMEARYAKSIPILKCNNQLVPVLQGIRGIHISVNIPVISLMNVSKIPILKLYHSSGMQAGSVTITLRSVRIQMYGGAFDRTFTINVENVKVDVSWDGRLYLFININGIDYIYPVVGGPHGKISYACAAISGVEGLEMSATTELG